MENEKKLTQDNQKETKKKKKPKRTPFQKVFLGYVLLVLAGFVALGTHLLFTLWWTPRAETGQPVLGYRMAYIRELDEAWLEAAENFGNNLSGVDYVSIFWNGGPVLYFNVRVNPGTLLGDARSVATEVVEYFIDISDEVALDYNLQVVVSYGVPAELRAEHQEAVAYHVHAFNVKLVEDILSYAENYPSFSNITRAYDNINVFRNSILAVLDEAGLNEFVARHAALEPLTADEEEALIEQLGAPIPQSTIEHQIPASDIADFPNWGAWSNERSRIIWSQ